MSLASRHAEIVASAFSEMVTVSSNILFNFKVFKISKKYYKHPSYLLRLFTPTESLLRFMFLLFQKSHQMFHQSLRLQKGPHFEGFVEVVFVMTKEDIAEVMNLWIEVVRVLLMRLAQVTRRSCHES